MADSADYSAVMEESRIDEVVELLRAFKAKTTQEAMCLDIQRDLEIRFIT